MEHKDAYNFIALILWLGILVIDVMLCLFGCKPTWIGTICPVFVCVLYSINAFIDDD